MAAAVAARGAAPDDLDAAWSGQHPTFAELRSFQKAIELAAEGGAKPLASQIVLIGQESAAKSATISALVPGLNLLSGAGSTTKTPTVINACHADVGSSEITLKAKVGHEMQTVTLSNDELAVEGKFAEEFGKMQSAVVDGDSSKASGYSTVEIHLDVRLPGCANITLVDLPGHVSSFGPAEKRTRELIELYLDKENSIPVVLLPCSTNPSSTSLLNLLADRGFGELSGESNAVFSPGPRCFYIRSKGDAATDEEFKAALSQAIELPARVFITASMPRGERLVSAAEEQELLVAKAGPSEHAPSLVRSVVGAKAISNKLEDLLVDDLRKLARPMLLDVRANIAKKTKRLEGLPRDADDAAPVVSALAEKLDDALRLPGPDDSDSLAMRAYDLVKEFERALQRETLSHVERVDWAKSRRKRLSLLQESGLAVDQQVIEQAANRLSAKLRTCARKLAESMADMLKEGLSSVLNKHEAEAPCRLDRAREAFANLVSEMKRDVLADIDEATEASKSFAPAASEMLHWPDVCPTDVSELTSEVTNIVASTMKAMLKAGEVQRTKAGYALKQSQGWRESMSSQVRSAITRLMAAKPDVGHASATAAEAASMSPQDDLLRQAKMRASVFGLRVHRKVVDRFIQGVEAFVDGVDLDDLVELDTARVEQIKHQRRQLAAQRQSLMEAEQRLTRLLPWDDAAKETCPRESAVAISVASPAASPAASAAASAASSGGSSSGEFAYLDDHLGGPS